MCKSLVEDCRKLPISSLRINYWVKRITIEGQLVEITSTKCNYGGLRKWFICPKCKRRVGVLYRKPLLASFLCRHCQNLTYRLTVHRRSRLEGFYKNLHQAV